MAASDKYYRVPSSPPSHPRSIISTGSNKTPSPKFDSKSTRCAYCGETITDVMVLAMDSTWHQDHFLCAHCKHPISSQKYHVKDGKSYCEADYTALFLKKCTACAQPIRDVVIMALGKPWHMKHFSCAECTKDLTHKGFYEKEGRGFCQDCYETKFCPSCYTCNKPIVDTAVIALGEKYHMNCFRCGRCTESIMDGTFKIKDGKPVCEKCYKK